MVEITASLFEQQRNEVELEDFTREQTLFLRVIERLSTQYPWFNGENTPVNSAQQVNPYDILKIARQIDYKGLCIDFFISSPPFNTIQEEYDTNQIKGCGLEEVLATGEQHSYERVYLFPLKGDSFTKSLLIGEQVGEQREEAKPYVLGVMKVEAESISPREQLFFQAYADQVTAGIQRVLRVQSFLHQIQQLQEANAVVEMICHDLKTPLSNIHVWCQMAEGDTQDEKVLSQLGKIKEISFNTSQVVGEYSGILKINRDSAVTYGKINLYTAVNWALDKSLRNNPGTAKKNLRIPAGLENLLNFEVQTDVMRLGALLRNVVSNFKYADSETNVDFYAERTPKGVMLSITTYGEGRDIKEVERVLRGEVEVRSDWDTFSQVGLRQIKSIYERIEGARVEIDCGKRSFEKEGYFTTKIFIPSVNL